MKHLHIVLFPLMAHGHMIPTLDMAKLFSSRGLKTTIISTPEFAQPIKLAQNSGHNNIGLISIKFPPEKSSLPPNTPTHDLMSIPTTLSKFVEALSLLQEPVEKILQELKPDCLVSDMLLPWTNNSAAKLGIPRLVFHGTSCFSLCVSEQMYAQKPYNNVSSDSEPFDVPDLPDKLSFVRSQVPSFVLADDDHDAFSNLLREMRVSDRTSYGVVFNSFHELEPAYADHYRTAMGRKSWHVGPLLLCSDGGIRDRTGRGEESCIDEHECLAWLDSKRPESVVYVCFGSIATFTRAQLHETAAGLEASSRDFIWVVRQGKLHNADGDEEEEDDDWFLPDRGFEGRVGEKGLIIRGWAPQLTILDHPSVGAFVTHCGWNSILEGICAGVPMVTWPVFAEQFFNEKLVTEVLGVGVPVGSKKWNPAGSEGVGREAVEAAVRRVMAGEEMRRRCEGFKEMGRKAVEEGGSSYNGLNALMDELSNLVATKN